MEEVRASNVYTKRLSKSVQGAMIKYRRLMAKEISHSSEIWEV